MEAITVNHAEAVTGNYFTKNVKLTGSVIPQNGTSHLISGRVQGALKGYYAGFTGENEVSLCLNNHGLMVLAKADYKWELGKEYIFEFELKDDSLIFSIDGHKVLEAKDSTLSYGMVGYAKYSLGRSLFGDLKVKEI